MQRLFNTASICALALTLVNTGVLVTALVRGPAMVKSHMNTLKVELADTLTSVAKNGPNLEQLLLSR